MASRETRRPTRGRRPSPIAGPIEALEGRQLMAYSPIGAISDLTVQGEAGAIAAYGGPLAVTLNVYNQGSASSVDPLRLTIGSGSAADSLPSHVGVYLSRNPHAKAGGPGTVLAGEVAIPSVPQNSQVTVTSTITVPNQPRRFPGTGGTFYVSFRADDLRETRDSNRFNNATGSQPVQVTAALPDLRAIAIDTPASLQPGDTIAPSIKIANYGAVNTNTQGPVTVLLVASTDQFYGPTDQILGQYTISSLPGLSETPSARTVLGDVNLDNAPDTITLSTTVDGNRTVTLPTSTTPYYLGVIVDPLNTIREISELGPGPSSALKLVRVVQPNAGLATAGVLSDPAPTGNVFPYPAFYPLVTLNDFLGTTTATGPGSVIYNSRVKKTTTL